MRTENEIKECLRLWKKIKDEHMKKSGFSDPIEILVKTTINSFEWVLENPKER